MTTSVSFDVLMTEEEMAAHRAGVIGYFAYGLITYKDIFNETHKSSFRALLYADGTFSHCEDGNHSN